MFYRCVLIAVCFVSPLTHISLASADANSLLAAPKTVESWLFKRRLAKVAQRLENALLTDPVGVATEVFELEVQSLRLLEEVGIRKASSAKREHQLANSRATVQRVLKLQERVREFAIERADQVLSPEPGRTLQLGEGGVDNYAPTFRGLQKPAEGGERTRTESMREMERGQREDKGVDTAHRRDLTRESLDELPSGQLAEWVQRGNDTISFSDTGAKHPVVARGADVPGAGSLKLFKSAAGEILLAVVAPTSGNYKPGLGATEALVQQLEAAGVPGSRILVTTASPADVSSIKVLMRVQGMEPKIIAKRLGALESRAGRRQPLAEKKKPKTGWLRAWLTRAPKKSKPKTVEVSRQKLQRKRAKRLAKAKRAQRAKGRAARQR